MRWLSYLHPAFMIVVLALGVFVLREGLRIRRGRFTGSRIDSSRHRHAARLTVVLALLGFAGGLVSMAWLRSKPLFGSFHSLLAGLALLGFLTGAGLGLRLERIDDPRTRLIHALCAGAGLLFALAAGVAGMSILP